jgi:hypothetical protein
MGIGNRFDNQEFAEAPASEGGQLQVPGNGEEANRKNKDRCGDGAVWYDLQAYFRQNEVTADYRAAIFCAI